MGISFNTYKKSKIEELIREQLYAEIFDTSAMSVDLTPHPSKYGGHYEVRAFKDASGNEITINFWHVGNGVFDLDFSVDGDSYGNYNKSYRLKEYTKLLATVAKSVDVFLDEVRPVGLVMDGVDSPRLVSKKAEKEGQKNRIYSYFVSMMEDRDDYKLEKTAGGGFNLIRKERAK